MKNEWMNELFETNLEENAQRVAYIGYYMFKISNKMKHLSSLVVLLVLCRTNIKRAVWLGVMS